MKIDEEYAYKMGYNCGENGANQINCDFRLFDTQELTYEWERGKEDAQKNLDVTGNMQ